MGTNYWRDLAGKNLDIYTDGSRVTSHGSISVGAGFVVVDSNTEIYRYAARLPNYSTIYQAEQEALFQAIDYLHRKGYNNAKCCIFVDSRSVLLALLNGTCNPRLNGIRSGMESLHGLSICWIPGHTEEIKYNDIADHMAHLGRTSQTCLKTPPSASHTASILDEYNFRMVNTTLAQLNPRLQGLLRSEHQRMTFRKSCQKLLDLPSLVVGHTKSYASYMHRIGRCPSPLCNGCQLEDDSPEHRALRCPMRERPEWINPYGSLGQFSISDCRLLSLMTLLK